MVKIKLHSDTPSSPSKPHGAANHWYAVWRRMASNPVSYTHEGKIEILPPEAPDALADFHLVVNHPKSLYDWDKPLSRTILVRLEPYAVHRGKWGSWTNPVFLRSLHGVIASDFNHNGIDWFLNRESGFLRGWEPSKKEGNLLSACISYKERLPGHKWRLSLIMNHLQGKVDLYGTVGKRPRFCFEPYKGEPPSRCKEEAVEPYCYHIAVENCIEKGYFTEKVVDAWMGLSLPLYRGCPDLADFVPGDAFVRLPEEMGEAAAFAARVCRSASLYRERLSAVREARELVLDKYNVWSEIAAMV